MNGMELDQLRGSWQQQSRRIDAALSLDIERVRARLQGRTKSAFQRHTRWLLLALGFGLVTLLALAFFIMQHVHDMVYLAASVPLFGLVLAEFATDVRQWRTLARLHASLPMIEVRETLQSLRIRRLRMLRWVLLSCVLLWLPAIAVLLKGLFGADLLRGMPLSVTLANLLVGLACIPLGIVLTRWFARRLAGTPAWQHLLDDASGRSFSSARNHLESQIGFEEQLAQSVDAHALLQQINATWPANAEALLHALKQRVFISLWCCAALLVLIGDFNVTHGGERQFLVPGLLLHFIVLAQMVASIGHLVLLVQTGPGQAPDLGGQLLALKQMTYWRSKVAQVTLIAIPLALVAALQALAKAFWEIDLYLVSAPWLHVTVALGVSLCCVVLALQLRRWPESFAVALLNVLSFGALAKSRALEIALERSPHSQ